MGGVHLLDVAMHSDLPPCRPRRFRGIAAHSGHRDGAE